MSTVSTAFEKAAAEDRAALVGYLPAGFPDKQTAIKAAVAMVEAGADVITRAACGSRTSSTPSRQSPTRAPPPW
jgi:2-methylisocitrate lyase-like PEP mutase family enzyme